MAHLRLFVNAPDIQHSLFSNTPASIDLMGAYKTRIWTPILQKVGHGGRLIHGFTYPAFVKAPRFVGSFAAVGAFVVGNAVPGELRVMTLVTITDEFTD